jgi:hypothetical protein
VVEYRELGEGRGALCRREGRHIGCLGSQGLFERQGGFLAALLFACASSGFTAVIIRESG